ncbi:MULTISPECIES: DUF6622 family protein [Stenotrophomonas]|uniref:DUF6622 family protein n=1 Tax=Stenotrophomonas TaxID=40323 RepID=UPI000C2621E0|nr:MULTISPECIES: DUF6622 family protein [Stenotrophomonas]MCU0999583.1 DUF1453 domain-containing protein [Stenotrophomonas maltophilia]MCU1067823.1 DUF1453 domain-containing protein [Stenotrophomonas maltophilia]MCU1074686.1 DUF1453 domain-containing protein [Stenotrophomonas maltophilia]MCU1140018.1 DUF1453 domain-containing protein [Stenotrophomonas maltophilia]PJL58790.1 DUF1453 domain-containing protein [Stenotrophomonas maltophilia]
MNMLQQLTSQTPIWVWLLLAFLVTRGIAAMKPGETSLQKLAIVPALFTAWGAWSISHRFGTSLSAWGEWLAGIGTGAALGWLLLDRLKLTMDRSTGKLWRNADFSLLPLLLITFLVKYGFEVAFAVSPSLTANAGFSAAYLLLAGGFTGLFIGKYCRYLASLRVDAAGKGLETAR